MEKYEILCIIPARSGSKGIKDKNIKLLNMKPLIYWSIKQALDCNYKMRIIVSTDSKEYSKIAKECGAEVPFLRPKNISGDLSTDFEFVEHCLNFLNSEENYIPDFIVQLRPTYPTRRVEILNHTIESFIKVRNNFDSLRTVIKMDKSPFKMYRIESLTNELVPLFKKVDNIIEPYNECRQNLPETFIHNGYIDIFNSNIIEKKKSITGSIYSYLMDKNNYHDIDSEEDFKIVEENFNELTN